MGKGMWAEGGLSEKSRPSGGRILQYFREETLGDRRSKQMDGDPRSHNVTKMFPIPGIPWRKFKVTFEGLVIQKNVGG
jgi:hypothetical protein